MMNYACLQHTGGVYPLPEAPVERRSRQQLLLDTLVKLSLAA